ncbi:hypothetical protein VP1G_08795 [Cytospora mali]|uniref:Uncharacterized protein n=1 Tax=Cytospora mali TaxID=578113 RepID=A0A194VC89_CYTMA|nr:hypothetical protein VP1G_08795 [Valsa mali var. pyri (nom. inval.)]
MAASYGKNPWISGQRMVEELDSGDDSDIQGVGSTATGGRFASDSLRFTGIDMGEGTARPRRKHAHGKLEDDESSYSDQDSDPRDENKAVREKEDALVESAMRRIRRAQAKGKQDVKLSKKELAALEQRRKRMQAEASGENKKKKKKEPRYAVPLSELGTLSQKESRVSRTSSDALPRHPSPELLARTQGGKVQPPVGWFAHPSSRPGTAESRRALDQASDREGSSSSIRYSYVQPPPLNPRHLSDPSVQPRSSRGPLPHEEARMVQYGASASVPSVPSDPFRFMTSGPQAPYHAGSAADLRHSSVSSSYLDPSYASSSSRRQSRQISPDATESEEDEDEDEMSDEPGAGVRAGSSNVGPHSGREQILVELDREPTPPTRPVTRSSRKTSANTSSPKRKSVGGGHGRKKKSSK